MSVTLLSYIGQINDVTGYTEHVVCWSHPLIFLLLFLAVELGRLFFSFIFPVCYSTYD